MSRIMMSCGLALVLVLSAPAWAQCEDCPMHKGGEAAQAAAPSSRIDLAIAGAETADAKVAIARGLEFVFDAKEGSLAVGEDGMLALPVGAQRIVKLSEVAAALEKISSAVQEKMPEARFSIDEARTKFTGLVRFEVKGLRCDGCKNMIRKKLDGLGEGLDITRQDATGLVALTGTDLALATVKSRLEGSHFELVDAQMGSPGCPHPNCEEMMKSGACPKGKDHGMEHGQDHGHGMAPGKAECPHGAKAEGKAECPHGAEGEKPECPKDGAGMKPGCCPKDGASK